MDLEQEPGLVPERVLVVAQMRAIRRADLDELGTRAAHDLGHPERAADLDELAARHDRCAALRERVEHEQHGGRVVVHDGRVLGARELAEQIAHVVVALAAPSGREIELERDRLAHRGRGGRDRLLGEPRAAEIRVQHDAREIEHGRKARPIQRLEPAERRRRGVGGGERHLALLGPRGRERVADPGDGRVAAEPLDERRGERRAQYRVDRRQATLRRAHRGARARSRQARPAAGARHSPLAR